MAAAHEEHSHRVATGSIEKAGEELAQEHHRKAEGKQGKEGEEVKPTYATPTGENDETVPGGNYVRGAKFNAQTEILTGGQIVNAEGEVLDDFADNEVNPGVPRAGKKAKKDHSGEDVDKLRKELEEAEEKNRKVEAELVQLRQEAALRDNPEHPKKK
jgi:hypothetical protein